MACIAGKFVCLFLPFEWVSGPKVQDSICGRVAISIHALTLSDLAAVVAVPTCDLHDHQMNGAVILKQMFPGGNFGTGPSAHMDVE